LNPLKSGAPFETRYMMPSVDIVKGWLTEVQWKSIPPVGGWVSGWGGVKGKEVR
jgi:hypothetical protein